MYAIEPLENSENVKERELEELGEAFVIQSYNIKKLNNHTQTHTYTKNNLQNKKFRRNCRCEYLKNSFWKLHCGSEENFC